MRIHLVLIAALSFISALNAYAQNDTLAVPQSAAQIQLSFAPVVKKVTPSVVNIYTKHIVQQKVSPFFGDPFFEQLFRGMGGLQLRPREANSLGSGVIVRDDGLIVTNAHVAQNAAEIRVVLSDKREYPAEMVLVDEKSDLALLKISKKEKFSALVLANSDKAEVGDLVLAIGNPFGVGQTVTSGIVSATARTSVGQSDFGYYIQTDAAINPGNSGGALVNLAGEVIGINTMIFSKTGGYMGIGFAAPANLVKQMITSYQTGGKTWRRAWLGASLQTVTRDIAISLNLDRPKGLLVSRVYADGPAEKAGVKRGDIIHTFNGQATDDIQSLRYILATREIGDTVKMIVLREGKDVELSFPITLPPVIDDKLTKLSGTKHPLSGAEVMDLSPALLEELGDENIPEEGVILKSVSGISARLGLVPKDVLFSINGQAVKSVKQLQGLIAKPQQSWRVEFIRNGQRLTLTIQG